MQPGKIVTGRHNEYTILADVSSRASESAILAGTKVLHDPGCFDWLRPFLWRRDRS